MAALNVNDYSAASADSIVVAEPKATAETAAPKKSIGEAAASEVLKKWKGKHVADAIIAATQIGLIHASDVLPLSRAKDILKSSFDVHLMDEKHWSTVNEAFQTGRNAVVTPADIRERYGLVAANDNAFIEPTPFEWREPSTIPPRDWIYGRHLLRRHVSATIASGAVGKSSLKIVEALALATGRPLLGHDVPKRSRVWLFNLEDEKNEMERMARS